MAIDPVKYQIAVDSTRNNTPVNYGVLPTVFLEDANGDFIISASDDLLIANEKEATAQYAQFLVKTKKNASPLFINFGSRIRDAVGMLQDIETYDFIEERLADDLADANIPIVEGSLEVLPLKDELIIINFIAISSANDKIQQTYSFDILSGSVEDIGGTQI